MFRFVGGLRVQGSGCLGLRMLTSPVTKGKMVKLYYSYYIRKPKSLKFNYWLSKSLG